MMMKHRIGEGRSSKKRQRRQVVLRPPRPVPCSKINLFLVQIALILLQCTGNDDSSSMIIIASATTSSTSTITITASSITANSILKRQQQPIPFVNTPRGGGGRNNNREHQEEEEENGDPQSEENNNKQNNKNKNSKSSRPSSASSQEDDVGDDDEVKEAPVDNNDGTGEIILEEDSVEEETAPSTSIGSMWPPSLFQLNNAIKAETASLSDDENDDEGDDEDDDGRAKIRNGRGGALVKTATRHTRPPPPQTTTTKRNIFFQWLTPPPPSSSDEKEDRAEDDHGISSRGSNQKQQDEDDEILHLVEQEEKDEPTSKEEEEDEERIQRRNNRNKNDKDHRDRNVKKKERKHSRLTSSTDNKQRRREEASKSSEQADTEAATTKEEHTVDDDIGRSRSSNKRTTAQQQQQQQTDTKTEEESEETRTDKQEGTAVDQNESKIISSSTDDDNNIEVVEVTDSTTTAPSSEETSAETPDEEETANEDVSPFVSSGYWPSIDKALTFGYASTHPGWRVSSKLRTVRKATARVTGLHGVLSGKRADRNASLSTSEKEGDDGFGSLNLLMRRRIAAIDRARMNVEREERRRRDKKQRRGFFWNIQQAAADEDIDNDGDDEQFNIVVRKSKKEVHEERRRKERVKEIDRLIAESQQSLQQLACEKDVLQRRPNPLWNYTTDEKSSAKSQRPSAGAESESLLMNSSDATTLVSADRKFSFPPPDLVEEYLDMLFSSRRLEKLNHTDLWKNNNGDIYDDDDDDDELSASSSNERRNGNGGSGSWLLRHGLGEKIGVAVETAAYKSVCAGVMSFLARSLSSLHGVNVMHYSDIRLYVEQAPDLPPLAAGIIPGSGKHANYAQGAIEKAMRRGAKRRKRRHSKMYRSPIQRDAVVETLLSQCQIAAPLLKLFPLAWQRAMLANCISMITAIFADFFEGLEFQILGHRLSFVFSPITEADMLRNLGNVGEGFNKNRPRPEQFEAAVQATSDTLAEELKFLDKWHERALGGGMLRSQIANLIARLVLSLTDDVLRGARIDLWTAHAGGPRLLAGLEYRTTPDYMDEARGDQ